jgi:hypothetical protein
MRAKLIVAVALVAAQFPALATGPASEQVPIVVTLSAALESKLADTYGIEEGEVLRAYVAKSLTRVIGRTTAARAVAHGVSVAVVLDDARPTHPTRRQLADNPSVDFLRSISLGGAVLTGTMRAADGRVLATVSHQYFAPDLVSISPAATAWADARVAIERFSVELAAKLAAAA